MRIKITELRAMARVLYRAVAAYRAHEPIDFERLSPNAKDGYLRMARIAIEETA
jgi:hypothetical protein